MNIRKWVKLALLFSAAVVMGIVVWVLYGVFGDTSSILSSLVTIAVLGVLGIAIFYFLAKLQRVHETELFDNILNKVKGRLKRGKA